jgi:hypothetical protein
VKDMRWRSNKNHCWMQVSLKNQNCSIFLTPTLIKKWKTFRKNWIIKNKFWSPPLKPFMGLNLRTDQTLSPICFYHIIAGFYSQRSCYLVCMWTSQRTAFFRIILKAPQSLLNLALIQFICKRPW